jgi:hypothetical protein
MCISNCRFEAWEDGMDGKQFVETAVLDFTVVDALHSAIVAMALTHGATVQLAGATGKLNYEREIGKLRVALALFGVDTTEPLPMPRRRRERR